MIHLAPGSRLGKTQNPPLAQSLGWYRIGSALSPVSSIVGQEPRNIVSQENQASIESVEITPVEGREGVYLITGTLSWDVVSKLPRDIVSALPDGIVSQEQIDQIASLLPSDLESDEPTEES